MLSQEAKEPRAPTTATTTSTSCSTATGRVQELMKCSKSVQWPDESPSMPGEEETAVDRLKRQRKEMAGRVWIPEIWDHDSFLKDWVDCSAFDSSLVPDGVVSARRSLVEECQRASPIAN